MRVTPFQVNPVEPASRAEVFKLLFLARPTSMYLSLLSSEASMSVYSDLYKCVNGLDDQGTHALAVRVLASLFLVER